MMDAWVKKVGRNKGRPRIFLDGVQAARAGFSPGDAFEVDVDGQRVTLIKKDDGSRVVSSRERNGRVLPVIDINSEKLLAAFEGMEVVRVVVTPNAVHILPLASEVKRVKRLERLRERLQQSLPLRTGSVSHGGGVLSHAIHKGLRDAGVDSTLAIANEIREDLLVQAIEHNDAWSDETMALALPMQELMQDEWLMSKLPQLELLELGLPCSGASKAGKARKGLELMEQHEHVGHLVGAALAILNKTQPVVAIFENVVDYSTSGSAYILRGMLRDMGYDIHEAVLRGADFGCLEDRVRWCMVACTKGLDFDFSDFVPTQTPVSYVRDALDQTIELDDPRWRAVQYLKDKRERDEAKGNGFKNQYIDPDSSRVPTLRKGYHKGGSPDPRLPHPVDPNLSRLLTAAEHASVKGVPAHLVEGLSETNAHQLLGQGIVYEPFRALGERVAQCLMKFATPESVRAAIAEVVGVDAPALEQSVGSIVVCTSEDAERSKERARQEAFSAWFDGSKIVDGSGKPLVVYHGTAANFNVFDGGRGGFYFTDDLKAAGEYAAHCDAVDDAAPRIVDAYLCIRNPLVLDRKWFTENAVIDGEVEWEIIDNTVYEAESQGYDGLVLRGIHDFDGMDGNRRLERAYDQYIAFRPEQIKSATGNRGTFNPKDPNILHSLAEADAQSQAWHDRATNTTYLFADRIPAGREASVFLHEIVHRHGRAALPQERFGQLVDQVKAWGDRDGVERAIHDAAQRRVATARVTGAAADEELFAYAVEEAVARGVQPSAAAVQGSAEAWLQAVVESIQRIGEKLIGNDLQGLDGQDLVDLAYALAQVERPEYGLVIQQALEDVLLPPEVARAHEAREDVSMGL